MNKLPPIEILLLHVVRDGWKTQDIAKHYNCGACNVSYAFKNAGITYKYLTSKKYVQTCIDMRLHVLYNKKTVSTITAEEIMKEYEKEKSKIQQIEDSIQLLEKYNE